MSVCIRHIITDLILCKIEMVMSVRVFVIVLWPGLNEIPKISAQMQIIIYKWKIRMCLKCLLAHLCYLMNDGRAVD